MHVADAEVLNVGEQTTSHHHPTGRNARQQVGSADALRQAHGGQSVGLCPGCRKRRWRVSKRQVRCKGWSSAAVMRLGRRTAVGMWSYDWEVASGRGRATKR